MTALESEAAALRDKQAAEAGKNFLRWLDRRFQAGWQRLVIAVPYLWLLLFFLIPFAIVLKISLAGYAEAMPPFTPLIAWADEGVLQLQLVFENFGYLFEDDLYWKTYLNSIKLSSISTVFCLLVGYPMAYYIAKQDGAYRIALVVRNLDDDDDD